MRRRLCVTAFLAGALAVLALVPSAALADHDYLPIFNTTTQGDITQTGNTLVTCFDADPRCAAARNGTASGADNNNNNLPVRWVNVVPAARRHLRNGTTIFNSSTAPLVLPSGAHVLKAVLLYTGRLQAGANSTDGNGTPAPTPEARNHVLLRAPGATGFTDLTASVDDAYDPSTGIARLYSGEVDVTSIVTAAGSGDYTVANVQIGQGLNADQCGGWSLVVAYGDDSMPPRAMTIFSGMEFVLADGPAVNIPLSGFTTPPAGPVRTNIGVVAAEGDLGTTGDSATLNYGRTNAWTMTDPGPPATPANNFFNSVISGPVPAVNTNRNPNYTNQLGFDAKTINADGRLANRQTSTTIRLQTNGDGFAPNIVWFSTNVYAPTMSIKKSVSPEGSVRLGQELTYTVDVTDLAGSLDDATDVVLNDDIPDGTTYVPGSLVVASGPNAGAKTDQAGDDQAEFTGPVSRGRGRRLVRLSSGHVTFRLGDGADASDGGRLDVGESTSIQFKVRVADNLPNDFQVHNSAHVSLRASSTGDASDATSNDVVTPVLIPDLAIEKSHVGDYAAGKTVPFTLKVSNVGTAPSSGTVTVTDPLGTGQTFVSQPQGDGWDCSASTSTALECSRSDALGAPSQRRRRHGRLEAVAWPPINYSVRVAGNVTVDELHNTATLSATPDGNLSNNTSSNYGQPTSDLSISKETLTPLVSPGEPVRYIIEVTNTGPDTANDVTVHDEFHHPGLTPIRARPSQGSCQIDRCLLGSIPAGETVRIFVLGATGEDTAGLSLPNTVNVTTTSPDASNGRKSDSAVVRVMTPVDLTVQKLPAVQTVPAGDTVTWAVVVTNRGPSQATHVTLDDALPPGLMLISAEAHPPGTCTGTTCDLGTLDAGASTTVVVRASSTPGLAGETRTNTATVSSDQDETVPDDNTDTARVTFGPPSVTPAPDVAVTKTADQTVVNVGDAVTYRITATNRGTGAAPHAMVVEIPDPNLEIVSVTPSQGSCGATVPIVCDLGPLAPGAHATVIVVARPLVSGTLSNGVVALPAAKPPLPEDEADIAAVPGPDVRLKKTVSAPTVTAGHQVTFFMTATAHGRGVAHNVQVCDSVPRGLVVVNAHGARRIGGRWCWTVVRLASGRSRTLSLDVRALSPAGPTTLVNHALLNFANRPQQRATASVRVLPTPPKFTG